MLSMLQFVFKPTYIHTQCKLGTDLEMQVHFKGYHDAVRELICIVLVSYAGPT